MFMCVTFNRWIFKSDLKSCCGDHCCYGVGFPLPGNLDVQSPGSISTSTTHPFSHIHIFSRDDHSVHPLEIASVWIAILFSLLVIILVTRNLWRHFHTTPLLKRLRIYAEGPVYETSVTEDGAIVPAINYFDSDEAREIVRRGKRGGKYAKQRAAGEESGKQYENIDKKQEDEERRRARSLQMLEMEFELLT